MPPARAAIKHVDAMVLKRVELALDQGQISKNVDSKSLSKLIQALLHSISIRVRAGESTATLKRFIEEAIVIILGEK